LENAEREAKRLEEALERGGKGLANADEERYEREREAERVERTQRKAGGSGFGLINAVKHSLSGMMDVDPEATRRANIGKTRDNIAQVSERPTSPALGLRSTFGADLHPSAAARRLASSFGSRPQICFNHLAGRPRQVSTAKGRGSSTAYDPAIQSSSGVVSTGMAFPLFPLSQHKAKTTS